MKKSHRKKSPRKKSPRTKSPMKKSPRKKSPRKKSKMDIHYDNKENEEKIRNSFEKSARDEYKKQSDNYWHRYKKYPYTNNIEIDKYINSIDIERFPYINLKEDIENLIDDSPIEKRRYDIEEGIRKRERDNKNGHNLRGDYDDYNF